MDSDFDMSHSKLRQLGVDISSLHVVEHSSNKTRELEDMRNRLHEYSSSVHGYTRKFGSDT